MERKELIKNQLNALLAVPGGEVDDTRFERLHDILKKYCENGPELLLEFKDQGFFDIVQVNFTHIDNDLCNCRKASSTLTHA